MLFYIDLDSTINIWYLLAKIAVCEGELATMYTNYLA